VKNLLPAEAGELHLELVLKVRPRKGQDRVIQLNRIGKAEPVTRRKRTLLSFQRPRRFPFGP
jgi:hypothetical protein